MPMPTLQHCLIKDWQELDTWQSLQATWFHHWSSSEGTSKSTSSTAIRVCCILSGMSTLVWAQRRQHRGGCDRARKFDNLDKSLTPRSKEHIAWEWIQEKLQEASSIKSQVACLFRVSGGPPLQVQVVKPPNRAQRQLNFRQLSTDVLMDMKIQPNLETLAIGNILRSSAQNRKLILTGFQGELYKKGKTLQDYFNVQPINFVRTQAHKKVEDWGLHLEVLNFHLACELKLENTITGFQSHVASFPHFVCKGSALRDKQQTSTKLDLWLNQEACMSNQERWFPVEKCSKLH